MLLTFVKVPIIQTKHMLSIGLKLTKTEQQYHIYYD